MTAHRYIASPVSGSELIEFIILRVDAPTLLNIDELLVQVALLEAQYGGKLTITHRGVYEVEAITHPPYEGWDELAEQLEELGRNEALLLPKGFDCEAFMDAVGDDGDVVTELHGLQFWPGLSVRVVCYEKNCDDPVSSADILPAIKQAAAEFVAQAQQ